MSSDHYRQRVSSLRRDIAGLQQQKASVVSDRARIQSRIADAQRSMSSNRSPSNVQSKAKDIERFNSDLSREENKVADYESKIAQKYNDLHRAEESLRRDEESEARQRIQEQKRRDDERRRREDDRNRRENRYREEQQRRDRQLADQRAKEMNEVSSHLYNHDVLHQQTMTALDALQRLPEKIVVLFVAANPADQDQLRLDEEIRLIEHKIRLSKHRDSVELIAKWAVRPTDLLQALNEQKPHIVHFSGHGSDQDEIIFLDDVGNTKAVSKDAVVQMMSAMAGNIQVAIFNTCYSQAQAEAVVRHIDVAIGMSASINDEAARIFSSQFYSAIGFGLSVQNAFNQAKALLALEGVPDATVPELFVRDGVNADNIILVRPPVWIQERASDEETWWDSRLCWLIHRRAWWTPWDSSWLGAGGPPPRT